MGKNKVNNNKKMSDSHGYYNPDISGVQQSEDYLKKREVEEAIDNEN